MDCLSIFKNRLNCFDQAHLIAVSQGAESIDPNREDGQKPRRYDHDDQ